MATPLDLAQQVFSLLNNAANPPAQGSGCPPGGSTLNATQTAVPSPTASPQFPTSFDVSSFLTFLLTFSALTNWLKLAALGAVLETIRRFATHLYYKIYNAFFITALFEDDDTAYDWMMIWLSHQPAWNAARDVQITSRSFGLMSHGTLIEGEDQDPAEAHGSSRKMAYLPASHTTFTFWYKRRWVRVNRSVRDNPGYYGGRVEQLSVCIMSWNHDVLNQMLLEAKKAYKDAQEHNISIYVSDSGHNWRHMASRPKRPLSSIVLDPGVKDVILEDARDFLLSKNWYAVRGIPFRRGYLLYGAPGTGKTSIIHSLAGELGLDVFIISLSRAGLDDTALGELISELPERCIALMEDIDAAFSQTLNRDADEESAKKGGSSGPPPPPKTTSRISLSGLLNALDGVGAQEGRILFATTNKYSALDPALCRPGRMDVHVEFKLASKYQAKELYKRFYLPDSEVEKLMKEEEEKKARPSDDSGYSSADEINEKEALAKGAAAEEELPIINPSPHKGRLPKLSIKQIEALSSKFSEAIPEREFSMAVLQGYLMGFKVRPYEAIDDLPKWIEKQRADKIEQAKKDKEKAEQEAKEQKEKQEKQAKEAQEAKDKKEKDEKVKEAKEKLEKGSSDQTSC